MLSSSASGGSSPGIERKRIRFNNEVEQYIAVEDNSDDDDGINSEQYSDCGFGDGLMIKRLQSQKRAPPVRRKSTNEKNSFTSDGKTVAILPSTTLNHRGHILEPLEEAMSIVTASAILSSCLPCHKKRVKHWGSFCEEGEDRGMTDVDVDADSGWYEAKSLENPGLYRRTSIDTIIAEPTGMRCTF